MQRYITNKASGAALGFLAILASGCAQTSYADTLAHWRFEGKPETLAPIGANVEDNVAGEKNDLAVANADTQPLYTSDVPYKTLPSNQLRNMGAISFNGRTDFYMGEQPINNVDFGPNGSNAWTVELSLRVREVGGVNRVFGRDGNALNNDPRGPLQILILGDAKSETFDIRAEIFDGSNTFRDVISPRIYKTGRWYNVAATASADRLNLYVDALDGKGYQLVGSKAIQGALSSSRGGFSIGRGWNGKPSDWMNGKVDEVRISNTALTPNTFLFSTPAGTGVVGPKPIAEPKPKPLGFELFYGADPHVAYFDNQYWMYITGRDFGPGNPSFFAYSSPNRKTWKEHGPILQFKNVPWVMAGPHRGPWAPAVTQKDGKYYLYYSVGPQSREHPARIGVAVGDNPAGPFVDKGEPLLVGGNGFEAIDAMVFTDPKTQKSYFYAGGSAGAKLRVFELNPDMISFAREVEVPTPNQFTEGAWMHERNGVYYLSYSHGNWQGSSYSVHYATGPSPIGPFTYKGALTQSDTTRKGPGHHSFIQDPKTKQWFIVYHRWQNQTGGNPLRARARSIAIEPIQYAANGDILPITQTDNYVPVLKK